MENEILGARHCVKTRRKTNGLRVCEPVTATHWPIFEQILKFKCFIIYSARRIHFLCSLAALTLLCMVSKMYYTRWK